MRHTAEWRLHMVSARTQASSAVLRRVAGGKSAGVKKQSMSATRRMSGGAAGDSGERSGGRTARQGQTSDSASVRAHNFSQHPWCRPLIRLHSVAEVPGCHRPSGGRHSQAGIDA
jgi:hypothetical protein